MCMSLFAQLSRKLALTGAALLMVLGAESHAADIPPALTTVEAAREIGVCAESLIVADLQNYSGAILIHINAAVELRADLKSKQDALVIVVNQLTELKQLAAVGGPEVVTSAQLDSATSTVQSRAQQFEQARLSLF